MGVDRRARGRRAAGARAGRGGAGGGGGGGGGSGAGLFAGPCLVGVLVVEPAGYGSDRVGAVPVAPLLADPGFAGVVGMGAGEVVPVGPRLRLAVSAETSVPVAPPYRPATPRLG